VQLEDGAPLGVDPAHDDAGDVSLSEASLRAIADFAKATDPAASDQRGALTADTLAQAKRMGLFGLSIPRAYGGLGLDLGGVCSAVEAIAFHDRALAATLGLHNGLGTRAIIAFGSESQRETWLPGLARGEPIAAFAATETSAGSDITALSTSARLGDDGVLRLGGSKAYITNGGLAGLFTVLARTESIVRIPRAFGMLLVQRGQAGFTIGPEEHKLGLRASSTTPLYFEDVAVERERVVGDAGGGMAQLDHVLAWGRIVMASGCCGAARSAVDRTIDHVTSRVQFGQTIGQLEVVRRQLADMAAEHFMMRALAGEAAACIGDSRTLQRSVAAKVLCSEALWRICDAAVQLHGGFGYMEGSGLPRLLRDARVMRIFEGANDVLLTLAGAAEVRAPRAPNRREVPERAAGVAELAARHARRISDVREGFLRAFGVRLLAKHGLLHRLGRLAVLGEAFDAVIGRAARDVDPHSARLASHWASLADLESDALTRDLATFDSVVTLTDALYAAGHA
jgi:alkylation response protein AidB-like acyl-CoA dehydrogenase